MKPALHMARTPFGITGKAFWRSRQLEGIRVRRVGYGAGYFSGHRCGKANILLSLEGVPMPGMSYPVADGAGAHCQTAPSGTEWRQTLYCGLIR